MLFQSYDATITYPIDQNSYLNNHKFCWKITSHIPSQNIKNAIWNIYTQAFITVTSQWVRGVSITSASIKAPRHWTLWGESTGDLWIPLTKGQYAKNVSIWWRHVLGLAPPKSLQRPNDTAIHANHVHLIIYLCPTMHGSRPSSLTSQYIVIMHECLDMCINRNLTTTLN